MSSEPEFRDWRSFRSHRVDGVTTMNRNGRNRVQPDDVENERFRGFEVRMRARGHQSYSSLANVPRRQSSHMKLLSAVCTTARLLTALTVSGVSAQSTLVSDGPPVEITGLPSGFVMCPRWSPDSSRHEIAFTSENYRGIWTIDLDTDVVRELTDEVGAGFGFEWSPDASALAARVSRYEGPRRVDAIKVFDAKSGAAFELTEYGARIRTIPTWAEGGESMVLGGKVPVRLAHPARAEKAALQPTAAIVTDGNVIRLEQDDRDNGRVLARLDNTVLNLVLSADRSMMAFEVLGGDLYVGSSDGSSIVSLGPGNRPSFSPDGQWVVFMRTRDDGHRFTASDLYVGRVSGEVRQLTDTPDALEMNPSWSPRGNEIAYDDKGRLYVLRVKEEN